MSEVGISFTELAKKLNELPEKLEKQVDKELKKVAMLVRDAAVLKFGTYQKASEGGFEAWEELDRDYAARKIEAGSPGDHPLIGHYSAGGKKAKKGKGKSRKLSGRGSGRKWGAPLRNTIGISVKDMVAQIGTDHPLAHVHEFGVTNAGRNRGTRIPPRPFLRSAAFDNQEKFFKLMGKAWEDGIK